MSNNFNEYNCWDEWDEVDYGDTWTNTITIRNGTKMTVLIIVTVMDTEYILNAGRRQL